MLSSTITSWPCRQPPQSVRQPRALRLCTPTHTPHTPVWPPRRTHTRTCSMSLSTRCDPTKPAPPVTKILRRRASESVFVGGYIFCRHAHTAAWATSGRPGPPVPRVDLGVEGRGLVELLHLLVHLLPDLALDGRAQLLCGTVCAPTHAAMMDDTGSSATHTKSGGNQTHTVTGALPAHLMICVSPGPAPRKTYRSPTTSARLAASIMNFARLSPRWTILTMDLSPIPNRPAVTHKSWQLSEDSSSACRPMDQETVSDATGNQSSSDRGRPCAPFTASSSSLPGKDRRRRKLVSAD
jgi:hypothetical protein